MFNRKLGIKTKFITTYTLRVMRDILESDWKKFKVIRETALLRYCDLALKAYGDIISKDEGSSHERYLEHFTETRERDKLMVQLFDGLSRSKASWQLLAYRAHDLVDDDMIAELSEELQHQTQPY